MVYLEMIEISVTFDLDHLTILTKIKTFDFESNFSYWPQGQHCPNIMKPPLAERLLQAQPDSVANHVTDRSIGDRCA